MRAAGEGPEAGPDKLRQHLEIAHDATRAIINALTAPELRGLWTRIKQELSEIEHTPR